MMTMPFGKHRGTRIDKLTTNYIFWLLDNIDLREPLKSALEAEHERRLFTQENDTVNSSIVDELVSAGLRVLSKKYHPDVGGDHGAMVELNRCADWLKQQARRIAA